MSVSRIKCRICWDHSIEVEEIWSVIYAQILTPMYKSCIKVITSIIARWGLQLRSI